MKNNIEYQKAVALVEDTLSKTGSGKYINTYVKQIMDIMYRMGYKHAKADMEKEQQAKTERWLRES